MWIVDSFPLLPFYTLLPFQGSFMPPEVPASVTHPEGLWPLREGEFLVASDIKTVDSNLYWLKAQTH